MKKNTMSLTTSHFNNLHTNPTDKELDKLEENSNKLKRDSRKSEMLNTARSSRHFGAKLNKSEAKSVLKELHNKTHFKAAIDFANFNSIFF